MTTLPPTYAPPSSPHSSSSSSYSSTENTDPQSAMEALQLSLTSGKYSDLTITHGSRQWKAHRVVVCSQSSVLEALILGQTGDPILDLSSYDEESVVLMMEYLYTSSYTTSPQPPQPPDFSLPVHIKVFELASELKISSGLQNLASRQFAQTLNNHVSDLDEYFSAVRQVYSSTYENSQLRLVVVEAAVTEMGTLLSENVSERFRTITHEVPEYQEDILTLLINHPQRPVHILTPVLCKECGPAEEGYTYTRVCNYCGIERSMESN